MAANANSKLTLNQQVFALVLADKAFLDRNVVAAWLLNEQSGTAAQYYQNGPAFYGGKTYNNWLNIGVTNGTDQAQGKNGTTSSIWANPVSAAEATAKWIATGQGVPNWARSGGVNLGQGQSPQTQIAAIQHSGWASGGETALPSLYQEIVAAGGLQQTAAQKSLAGKVALAPNTGISKAVTGAANAVTGTVNGVSSAVGVLTNPSTWARVGKFAFGSVLVFMGLRELSGGGGGVPSMLPREALAAVGGAAVEHHRAGTRARAAAAAKPKPKPAAA